MTKDEFKAGVLFLISVRNDYQLDPNSPDHCGFLACGEEITDDLGFQSVANNPEEFEQVMDELGLDTEEGFHLDDTVFILK
jgi:hypothetical protein